MTTANVWSDSYLGAIIDSTEAGKASFTVTLLIEGAVVSGVVLSRFDYISRRSRLLHEHNSSPDKGEYVPVSPDKISPADPEAEPLIYLGDTVIASGHTKIIVGLWCGRINKISGYNLGYIGLNQPEIGLPSSPDQSALE